MDRSLRLSDEKNFLNQLVWWVHLKIISTKRNRYRLFSSFSIARKITWCRTAYSTGIKTANSFIYCTLIEYLSQHRSAKKEQVLWHTHVYYPIHIGFLTFYFTKRLTNILLRIEYFSCCFTRFNYTLLFVGRTIVISAFESV